MLRLVAQEFGPGVELPVVGGKNSALTHHHSFGTVKAEAAHIPQRAGMLPVVKAAHALRRVFDDIKAPFPRDGVNLVHFARMSVEVDRDDSLRPWRHCAADSLRVNGPVVLAHVYKDGGGADIGHRVGGGHPGAVRQDHLVPWAHAHGQQGQMERGGAGGGGDGVFHPQGLAHGLLKALQIIKAFFIPTRQGRVGGIPDLQGGDGASRH